jgi:hypothetical protein
VQEVFFSPDTRAGFRQNINVYVIPTDSTSLQSAIENFQKRFGLKVLKHHEAPKQCGHFQGSEVSGEEEVPNGRVAAYHGVVVLANSKIYGATYTRLKEQSDDIDAIEAVDGFCNSPLFGGVAYSL